MGSDVSLVSVSVSAPPLTANGELVSLVCLASAKTCAVSSIWLLEVGGDGGAEGGEGIGDPLWSPPPHAETSTAAAAQAAVVATLRFMV